jgi:hypothetical protein
VLPIVAIGLRKYASFDCDGNIRAWPNPTDITVPTLIVHAAGDAEPHIITTGKSRSHFLRKGSASATGTLHGHCC